MPDFTQLLRKPSGTAQRPPTLPGGDYRAITRKFEWGASDQKKTPRLRYAVGLLDWPSDAPDEWDEVDENGKVWHYAKSDIDLGKRQQTFDFYFPVDENTGEATDGSLWRLDEFLRSVGVEPDGRDYQELIPETVGQEVLLVMKQELNNNTNRIFCRPDRMIGTAKS